MTPTTDLDALVTAYVATWNDPDPTRRRSRIEALWAVDGIHATATLLATGYDQIEQRIGDAHRRFVTDEGHRFARHRSVDGHHDTVRFAWEMRPADGGEVVATGFDFLIIDSAGRILADYQYPYPLP